ncbi:MAG: substrate-binding domain-containing protein [Acidobacteria bacterium]|nr:substrate-binding domain-containing protein [Acidobacteriota bacterium]
MFSRCRSLILAGSLLLAACAKQDAPVSFERHYIEPPKQTKIAASETTLRVCADPNNLPFSNKKGEGFENKIAELIGSEMHRPVEYTWWAERRGFFRNTLRAGVCDVVMGVPVSFELAVPTRSYYRSTYVFVTRKDGGLNIHSFDDPQLRSLRIGVQMIGDDGTNAPPAHALANRGIINNVRGYTVYGNYTEDSPPARIIDAVVNKDIDVAIVWGPMAGYFAAMQKVPLDVRPVSPEIDLPYLPFVYDIAVGVRRGENDLKDRIDSILADKHTAIDKILDSYHLPRPAAKEGV